MNPFVKIENDDGNPQELLDDRQEGTKILVEIISEGPHCVPCDYAIAAVEYVAEIYSGKMEVRVVETKRVADAHRYLELRKINSGNLPVPSILINGILAFDRIPGPEELCDKLNEALFK
ncbi:MAG: thioredoxin-like (seleno)protein [Desulfomonilaceae bacterium]